jgi:hypothetical protein
MLPISRWTTPSPGIRRCWIDIGRYKIRAATCLTFTAVLASRTASRSCSQAASSVAFDGGVAAPDGATAGAGGFAGLSLARQAACGGCAAAAGAVSSQQSSSARMATSTAP